MAAERIHVEKMIQKCFLIEWSQLTCWGHKSKFKTNFQEPILKISCILYTVVTSCYITTKPFLTLNKPSLYKSRTQPDISWNWLSCCNFLCEISNQSIIKKQEKNIFLQYTKRPDVSRINDEKGITSLTVGLKFVFIVLRAYVYASCWIKFWVATACRCIGAIMKNNFLHFDCDSEDVLFQKTVIFIENSFLTVFSTIPPKISEITISVTNWILEFGGKIIT